MKQIYWNVFPFFICLYCARLEVLCYTIRQIKHGNNIESWEDHYAAQNMIRSAQDTMKDMNARITGMQFTRLISMDHFAWQVGYITFELQDKYRKMIDKYNTSLVMERKLFLMEHILYLVEMEYAFWEIDHYGLLIHEVELKYKQNISAWNSTWTEGTTTMTTVRPEYDGVPDYAIFTQDMDKRQKTSRSERLPKDKDSVYGRWTSTRKRPTRWWWPGEYGWEPDYPLKKK